MQMKVYACYNKDTNIRMNSSSGGIFSLLAETILLGNGVVYGIAMTEDCYGAEMIRVEDDIAPLRGSKYLQAKVGDAYKKVKEDLNAGKHVLFTGTGCQVNGLKAFLGKDFENLVCVDVVCHGVPSQKLWEKYVKHQELRYGKLTSVDFRCKDMGWQEFGIKENQMYVSRGKHPFMNMFLDDFCLRPSCYECHAKYYKNSDITIADFWGIDSVAPEMNDNNGTSLVIVRTDKGEALFESIKNEVKRKEVSYDGAVRGNSAEYISVGRPQQRNTFFADLENLSFEEMVKKYVSDTRASMLKTIIRRVKKLVKRIFGAIV